MTRSQHCFAIYRFHRAFTFPQSKRKEASVYCWLYLPPVRPVRNEILWNPDCFSSGDCLPLSATVTPTTTKLSSSLDPSIYGQVVSFSAVVTSILGAPPDEEVVTLEQGSKILGTAALSGGKAIFMIHPLPMGARVSVLGCKDRVANRGKPANTQSVENRLFGC